MKISSTDINSNLNKAKIRKDDELFTRVEDIEAEVLGSGLYDDSFSGKKVLCNPDQFELIGVDRYVIPKEFQVGGRAAVNGMRSSRELLSGEKIREMQARICRKEQYKGLKND